MLVSGRSTHKNQKSSSKLQQAAGVPKRLPSAFSKKLSFQQKPNLMQQLNKNYNQSNQPKFQLKLSNLEVYQRETGQINSVRAAKRDEEDDFSLESGSINRINGNQMKSINLSQLN